MRLNRNSVIFIALLVVVIAVALIFLQDDSPEDTTPIEPTSELVRLFPTVQADNVTSLTVEEQSLPEAEATPEVDAEEATSTTALTALNRDDSGMWVLDETSTQTLDGTLNSTQVDSAITTLLGLSSNRQFIPADGDYAQFGLDDPTFTISFVEQVLEVTNIYQLRLGNRTVGENAYYAFLADNDETIHVITNANRIQTNVLNLAQQIPLEPTAVPTEIPTLNTIAPFADFVLTIGNGFVFRDNQSGDTIRVERNAENTEWVYIENDEQLPVQQETLQVILNNFSTISGVDEVADADLAILGLDNPTYTFEASTVNGTTYTLQLGNQDPTGSVYYGLVDNFPQVVLIDSDSVAAFITLFETQPPLLEMEATPEATEPMSEATESAEDSD